MAAVGRPSNSERIKANEEAIAKIAASGSGAQVSGVSGDPLPRPVVMAYLLQGFASIPDARIADRAEKASRVGDRIYEGYVALCKGGNTKSVYDKVDELTQRLEARDKMLGETRDKLATSAQQIAWYRERLTKAGMEAPEPEAVPV